MVTEEPSQWPKLHTGGEHAYHTLNLTATITFKVYLIQPCCYYKVNRHHSPLDRGDCNKLVQTHICSKQIRCSKMPLSALGAFL